MISEDFEKTSIALMDLTNINLDDRKFNSYKNKLSIGLIRVFDDEFQIHKRYKVTLGEHSYTENYFNPKMELIKQPSVAENDVYNIDRSFFIEIQKITSYNIYYKGAIFEFLILDNNGSPNGLKGDILQEKIKIEIPYGNSYIPSYYYKIVIYDRTNPNIVKFEFDAVISVPSKKIPGGKKLRKNNEYNKTKKRK